MYVCIIDQTINNAEHINGDGGTGMLLLLMATVEIFMDPGTVEPDRTTGFLPTHITLLNRDRQAAHRFINSIECYDAVHWKS
jgi:hypothetical protein